MTARYSRPYDVTSKPQQTDERPQSAQQKEDRVRAEARMKEHLRRYEKLLRELQDARDEKSE